MRKKVRNYLSGVWGSCSGMGKESLEDREKQCFDGLEGFQSEPFWVARGPTPWCGVSHAVMWDLPCCGVENLYSLHLFWCFHATV